MFATVELPLWLVVLGGALMAVALVDRLLMPSVRWVLRRRLNQAIAQLNERLELKIPPFKLTRRAVLIDRLSNDPQVMRAVMDHAHDEGVPVDIAAARAVRYARETVPSFSAFAYFSFGTRAAKWLSEALYRVRLGRSDDDGLSRIGPGSTVVFVMNHRSNMDYVLVTYLAASRSALSYAVGEWARVWPLQTLIRSMGAYFIRRRSRDALYRKVLARYVQMATEGGVTQAIFLEGRLSRDGGLQPPKLGLLSYIVAGFDPVSDRDVAFVPVAINYDRVIEDRNLLAAHGNENAKFSVGLFGPLAFILKQLWLRALGRYHRYGYACVSFGTPVSLREAVAARPDAGSGADFVPALAEDLMARIAGLVPVLPVPLAADVLLDRGAMSGADLKVAILSRMETFAAKGIYNHIPRGDRDYAVDFALRALAERGLITQDGGQVAPARDGAALLRYYANSIAHFDQPPSAVETDPAADRVPPTAEAPGGDIA